VRQLTITPRALASRARGILPRCVAALALHCSCFAFVLVSAFACVLTWRACLRLQRCAR
jgi:hypothetical protein